MKLKQDEDLFFQLAFSDALLEDASNGMTLKLMSWLGICVALFILTRPRV